MSRMIGRRKQRLAALLGLSAVWLLLLCGSALAHARLAEEYPGDGDVLSEPPEQVQLRFNESVEAEFDPIEVYDEQDNRVDLGNTRVSPDNPTLVVTDLEEGLSEGSYAVNWRVTSADGHPIDGGYGFAVDASAANAEEGAGEPIEPVERAAKQEEEANSAWGGTIQAVLLGVLLIGALTVAGFVVLRRR